MDVTQLPYRFVKRLTRAADRMVEQRAHARRVREAKAALASRTLPVKLNLGCGDTSFEGWVNVDLENRQKANLLWDLTQRLPLPDGSCSLIYSEHVMEHFTVEDGLKIFRECYRLLQSGGILRVAMPDLAHCVDAYVRDSWRPDFQRWEVLRSVKTRCEALNVALRWWGHLWLYDHEELHRRLGEAGFAEIHDMKWGESEVPEFRGRETRVETYLIVEAAKH